MLPQLLARASAGDGSSWHWAKPEGPHSTGVLKGKLTIPDIGNPAQTTRSKRGIVPPLHGHDPRGRVTWQSTSGDVNSLSRWRQDSRGAAHGARAAAGDGIIAPIA